MSDIGQKYVRLAPNGTNMTLFKIIFQYILARRAKMYWKLILKSQIFVPFGTNLTQIRVNSDTFPVYSRQARHMDGAGGRSDESRRPVSAVLLGANTTYRQPDTPGHDQW